MRGKQRAGGSECDERVPSVERQACRCTALARSCFFFFQPRMPRCDLEWISMINDATPSPVTASVNVVFTSRLLSQRCCSSAGILQSSPSLSCHAAHSTLAPPIVPTPPTTAASPPQQPWSVHHHRTADLERDPSPAPLGRDCRRPSPAQRGRAAGSGSEAEGRQAKADGDGTGWQRRMRRVLSRRRRSMHPEPSRLCPLTDRRLLLSCVGCAARLLCVAVLFLCGSCVFSLPTRKSPPRFAISSSSRTSTREERSDNTTQREHSSTQHSTATGNEHNDGARALRPRSTMTGLALTRRSRSLLSLCLRGSCSALCVARSLSLSVVQVKVHEKKEGNSLGPLVIGFFLFVVVGSALFQIIRTAQSGKSF